MIGGLISYGAGLPPYGIPLALAVAAVGVWSLAHPERGPVETPSACPQRGDRHACTGFGELHALLVHCLVMIGGSREPTTGLYLVGSGRQRRDGADDQTMRTPSVPIALNVLQNILRQLSAR